MPHDPRKLLEDMRLAAERVERFTAGLAQDDYSANELLRAAVERQFEIVGEALNRLLKVDPSYAAKISEHRRIVGFRNILIHGYDAVDDTVVWDVVQKNLPVLRQEIAALLAVFPPP